MADEELPELENDPINAIDLIKQIIERCKPVFIYHCFKVTFPKDVKTYTEQWVELQQNYNYTKKDAVINLAETLIEKYGESKIIKLMDDNFPKIKEIKIQKEKQELEIEKILETTMDEKTNTYKVEKAKIKQPKIKYEQKVTTINEALNELIQSKENTEEEKLNVSKIQDYWYDIQQTSEINKIQHEQSKKVIKAQKDKSLVDELNIVNMGNEIWNMKKEYLRKQNNELMKDKIEELTTSFSQHVEKETYDELEQLFNEQINMVKQLRIDFEKSEKDKMKLETEIKTRIEKEELDEVINNLLETTGKLEICKKQLQEKENEINKYMTKIKIYEDPITPEMARKNRQTEVTLKLQQLREQVENEPLFTPINRKSTLEVNTINTGTFIPKITSTKEIKTNLYESKYKEPIYKDNIQNHIKNTITKFNGEGAPGTAFDSWIKVFEKNADLSEWSNERRIRQLPIYLEKTAADFYDQLSTSDKNSIEIIKRKFKQRFDLIETPEVCISRLMLAKKKKDEGSRAFGQRIQMLYDKAYPYKDDEKDNEDKQKWREEYKNIQLTQLFINGMNKDMILYLKGKEIKDFNKAIDSACEREEVLASLADRAEAINAFNEQENKQPANKQANKKPQPNIEKTNVNENKTGIKICTNCQKPGHTIESCFSLNKHCNHCNIGGHTDVNCWRQRPCNMCKQTGHPQIRCPKRATINCDKCKKQGHYATECDNQNNTDNRQTSGICNYCGNPGHNVAICRVKQMKESGNSQTSSSGARNSQEGKGCFKCGGSGHFIANCPNKDKNSTN